MKKKRKLSTHIHLRQTCRMRNIFTTINKVGGEVKKREWSSQICAEICVSRKEEDTENGETPRTHYIWVAISAILLIIRQ